MSEQNPSSQSTQEAFWHSLVFVTRLKGDTDQIGNYNKAREMQRNLTNDGGNKISTVQQNNNIPAA